MLKACIEIVSNGKYVWTNIPNENLGEEISIFTGNRDWECTIITGLVKDGITLFTTNSFHKCDIFEFNKLILWLQENHGFNNEDIQDFIALNLLLQDNHYDCDEVQSIYDNGNFYIYKGVFDIEDVAYQYLENHSPIWYDELKKAELLDCFDFKTYGEEILCSNGTWLQDKNQKIFIEIFD